MPSIDQFTLLQGGGFNRSLLSFLEIDRHGNVNVHHLPKKRHVTAGVGGFADITSSAPEIIFMGAFTAGRRDIAAGETGLDIRSDGPFTKLVNDVSAVTFSGPRALARAKGQIHHRTCRAGTDRRRPRRDRNRPRRRPAKGRPGPQSSSRCRSVNSSRSWTHASLRPERIGLTLNPTPPHARIASLTDGTGAHPGGTAAVQESHP